MGITDKKKERIRMVLFMFFISAVFVSIISFVHLSTREMVKKNETIFLKKSVLYTAGIAVPDGNEKVNQLFSRVVAIFPDEKSAKWYRISKADGSFSYVFPQSGAGLWGEISAFVGIDASFSAITGIDFIKQAETPGLGARISEEWFREQFRGKKGPFLFVPEGTARKNNEFDAITGATVTTRAVQQIVNSALKEAPELIKGEKNEK